MRAPAVGPRRFTSPCNQAGRVRSVSDRQLHKSAMYKSETRERVDCRFGEGEFEEGGENCAPE